MAKAVRGQKKATTIWLEAETGKVKLFRCMNCSIPVAEYTGNVVQVVPGNHPYTPSTIHRCKGTLKPPQGFGSVDSCTACNGRGYFIKGQEAFEECGMYYSFPALVHTKNPEFT